jgi:hypothetical protein
MTLILRTNQQIIDLWRSLLPSIKKDGNKLTIKSRGATSEIKAVSSPQKLQFSNNRQYR